MEATPVPILVVLGMLVGAVASLVSLVYGILLSSLVNLVWRELPALCSAGPWYITAATTIGAVSVALLASTCLPLHFVTPSDFISSFRKPDPATEFGKQLTGVYYGWKGFWAPEEQLVVNLKTHLVRESISTAIDAASVMCNAVTFSCPRMRGTRLSMTWSTWTTTACFHSGITDILPRASR